MNNLAKKEFRASDGATIYLLAIVSIFILSNTLGIFLAAIKGLEQSSLPIYEALNMLSNMLLQAGLIGVYFLYTKKLKVKPQIRMQKCVWQSCVLAVIITVITMYGYILPATYFDEMLVYIGYTSSAFSMQTLLGKIIMFIATVFIAPIGEELIFRGALISGLRRKFGDVTCVLLSGIMFSLMHTNPAQTVYQFGLGCSLAVLSLSSGSVIPCIICHATSNFIACIMQFFPKFTNVYFAPIFIVNAQNKIWVAFLMLVAIVATVLIYKFLKNLSQKKYPKHFVKNVRHPEFFNQYTLLPVYKDDDDYEYQYNLLFNNQKDKEKNNSSINKERYDQGIQDVLTKDYNARQSECGGVFGKNTFYKCIIIGLGFCVAMWLFVLFATI